MTTEEELQTIRMFLHKIHLHYALTLNSDRVKEALNIISDWSRAHRQGNGESTEGEVEERINNYLNKMEEF